MQLKMIASAKILLLSIFSKLYSKKPKIYYNKDCIIAELKYFFAFPLHKLTSIYNGKNESSLAIFAFFGRNVNIFYFFGARFAKYN